MYRQRKYYRQGKELNIHESIRKCIDKRVQTSKY